MSTDQDRKHEAKLVFHRVLCPGDPAPGYRARNAFVSPQHAFVKCVLVVWYICLFQRGQHYPKSAGRVVKRLPSAHLEQIRIPFANQVLTITKWFIEFVSSLNCESTTPTAAEQWAYRLVECQAEASLSDALLLPE